MFAVVVVLSPLQSAGEEYGFRGLIFRVAASWGRGARTSLGLGVVVSTVLFVSVHASGDPLLNLYYAVVGASLALVTWRTGGLETACVAHALNNTLAFLVGVVVRSDLVAAADRSAGAVQVATLLLPGALFAGTALVVFLVTRRPSH